MSVSYDAWSCYMMVMSYNTSPTIDACSCDISPAIDAWLYHMIHHLPSMHGHVTYCITYHRCMLISYDAWSCHIMHHLQLMHGYVILCITYHRCMVISYSASPTIDVCQYHMMLGHAIWLSCHIMHHLPSMYVNIIWCLVMLYDGRVI
jgi:hypothetical protein